MWLRCHLEASILSLAEDYSCMLRLASIAELVRSVHGLSMYLPSAARLM